MDFVLVVFLLVFEERIGQRMNRFFWNSVYGQ